MGATAGEIEHVYRSRYAAFRRALAAVTGSYDTAHDVVQEAFARALSARTQFRREGSLEAWIWRIAVRLAHQDRDQLARRPLDEPATNAIAIDGDPDLARAIRSLPPRRRLIFFLRYFAGLSYSDIAAVCDISEGTVAAALAQARESLSRELEEVVGR